MFPLLFHAPSTEEDWVFDPKLEGKRRENIAWPSELCVVMYGEQHLFIGFLPIFLFCVMYNINDTIWTSNLDGNTLISARKNGMLLPVD